jgi:hypothetical protein
LKLLEVAATSVGTDVPIRPRGRRFPARILPPRNIPAVFESMALKGRAELSTKSAQP